MIIAVDYDDTYTKDPAMWDEFIANAQRHGHTVYCVTMRAGIENRQVVEALQNKVDGIFCTDHKAKQRYMFDCGINVDVWIDDSPNWVITDALPRALETQ